MAQKRRKVSAGIRGPRLRNILFEISADEIMPPAQVGPVVRTSKTFAKIMSKPQPDELFRRLLETVDRMQFEIGDAARGRSSRMLEEVDRGRTGRQELAAATSGAVAGAIDRAARF